MSRLLELFLKLPKDIITFSILKLLESRILGFCPKMDISLPLELVPEQSEKPESEENKQNFPSFNAFASYLFNCCKSIPAVMLGCCILIDRLRGHLSPAAYGTPEASYSVFSTALLLSSKVLVDNPLQNHQWATMLAPWFTLPQINVMERQFLKFVDYELEINEHHMESLISKESNLFYAIIAGNNHLVPSNESLESNSGYDSRKLHYAPVAPRWCPEVKETQMEFFEAVETLESFASQSYEQEVPYLYRSLSCSSINA